MRSMKRLQNELKDIQKDPPIYISAGPLQDNLYEWEALIIGPKETPYEDGLFILEILIPFDYPMKPPNVIFKTKIFHPNINHNGNICLDILKNNWKPSLTLSKILLSILSLLNDPNINDPLVPDIAKMYQEDQSNYIRTAREWTFIYAKIE